MKNSGPNLTMDHLAALNDVNKIIEEILKKAGLIDFERLYRFLSAACKLSKQEIPKIS